jgi:hypothetical protein
VVDVEGYVLLMSGVNAEKMMCGIFVIGVAHLRAEFIIILKVVLNTIKITFAFVVDNQNYDEM